ncbi:hypothetical protein [Streptomyces sp. H34-S4]|uniref:hypothetical protein n=1 Tax=Streptomyces sp. H34-S4 TaxID=2996463 RepID=UPI0022720F9D|nr:hypothetical protein [Streptomyces sp. H34-S4]MCY0933855.1 hypothetical protein [Streptomyces sp. H34-S4]
MTTAAYACSAPDLAGAASLVRFGCQPRLRPMQHPEYRTLLHRYRRDGMFAALADGLADGLEMDVIDAHDVEGYVLHPREGSWLSYRLKDGSPRMTPADRLVLGLAHVAIAARAYPTAADLEEETVKRVSVEEVDHFLRHMTQRLKEAAVDAEGLAVPHTELDAAWRLYSRLPAGKPTRSKRQLSEASTQRVIKEALDWLVEQGMAVSAAVDLGPGHYRLYHRFRLQVRECASASAFGLLCDIRRSQLVEEN